MHAEFGHTVVVVDAVAHWRLEAEPALNALVLVRAETLIGQHDRDRVELAVASFVALAAREDDLGFPQTDHLGGEDLAHFLVRHARVVEQFLVRVEVADLHHAALTELEVAFARKPLHAVAWRDHVRKRGLEIVVASDLEVRVLGQTRVREHGPDHAGAGLGGHDTALEAAGEALGTDAAEDIHAAVGLDFDEAQVARTHERNVRDSFPRLRIQKRIFFFLKSQSIR